MQTLFIGKKHLKFNQLKSTNTCMKELLRSDKIIEGTIVQTEYQTSGRGQFGNEWTSEKGKNLLFSLLLRPSFLSSDQQFYLNMSVCLALADALNQLKEGFVVKWPNDILFKKKKVCGVLIENSLSGNKIEHSIVGIGLNVNQEDFIYPDAASLKTITGKTQDMSEILRNIAGGIEQRYLQLRSDLQLVRKDYLKNLYGFREHVPVLIRGKRLLIQVENVEKNGKIIVQLIGEEEYKSFNFKEISFVLA